MPSTSKPPDAAPNGPHPDQAARARESAGTRLSAELPDLPGIDLSRGLRGADGNHTLYRRLLAMFGESHRDLRARVSTLMDQRDLPGLARLAHTLRGSAAGLGMASLASSALQLERALKLGINRAELNIELEIVYLETELIVHSLVQGGIIGPRVSSNSPGSSSKAG